jgi:hypothetical protein
MTPWGVADPVAFEKAEGIERYTTPSHGGYFLSKSRLEELTNCIGPVDTFCGHPQWFEEDCDWAFVAIAFPQFFSVEELNAALNTIRWLKAHNCDRANCSQILRDLRDYLKPAQVSENLFQPL